MSLCMMRYSMSTSWSCLNESRLQQSIVISLSLELCKTPRHASFLSRLRLQHQGLHITVHTVLGAVVAPSALGTLGNIKHSLLHLP